MNTQPDAPALASAKADHRIAEAIAKASPGGRVLRGGIRGHRSLELVAAGPNPNSTMFNLLYGAMVGQLGLSPQTFQMISPMQSWDWATPNTGYCTTAQYDFCATIPQWSAIGAYISSGVTFDGAYQQFLNDIYAQVPANVQQEVIKAQNLLTQATNDYTSIYGQANNAYTAAVPTGNNPNFTAWLASPAGFAFSAQLTSAQTAVTDAQTQVTNLLAQSMNPNLANAQKAMLDPANLLKLSDAPTFKPVPAYNPSITSAAWVQKVQGSGGTPASITFNASSQTYDYSQSWAQSSSSTDFVFFSVQSNNQWQSVSQFASDSALSVSISFKAWETIGITPGGWYSGTTQFKGGPYLTGYSANQKDGGQTWMFGQGGLIPLLKTGMVVCYQPTFAVTVSESTYQSFQSQWSSGSGFGIGPFQITGDGSGGSVLDWSQSGSTRTLNVASTSTIPMILGVTVAVEPQ